MIRRTLYWNSFVHGIGLSFNRSFSSKFNQNWRNLKTNFLSWYPTKYAEISRESLQTSYIWKPNNFKWRYTNFKSQSYNHPSIKVLSKFYSASLRPDFCFGWTSRCLVRSIDALTGYLHIFITIWRYLTSRSNSGSNIITCTHIKGSPSKLSKLVKQMRCMRWTQKIVSFIWRRISNISWCFRCWRCKPGEYPWRKEKERCSHERHCSYW